MTFIRWIKRGCRFQLYRDFYGRLKIKPMGVCAHPQWITFGSLWKCIKEYIIKAKKKKAIQIKKKKRNNWKKRWHQKIKLQNLRIHIVYLVC